jgi:hypothetical protein
LWNESYVDIKIGADIEISLLHIHMSTVVNEFLLEGTTSLTICAIPSQFKEEEQQVRPRDAVESKNRRRFVCCCNSVATEKEADETRSNGEVPSSDNLLNHSSVAVPIKSLIR